MTRTTVTLLAFIFIGCAFDATAQDFSGEVVKPVGQLPLRASPPSSFFQSKGAPIATVNPGDSYRVITQQTVKTFAGSQDWIELQSMDAPSVTGWAFAGPSGNPSNFLVVDQD